MAWAISIRQPWAHAILNLGKRVENRTWTTRFRGPIYIHASKGMTRDEYGSFVRWWRNDFEPNRWRDVPTFTEFDELPRGGIVGKAEIIDCIRSKNALPHGVTREWGDRHIVPWWQGPVGLVFDKVEQVPFVECPGKLSIFEIDEKALCL